MSRLPVVDFKTMEKLLRKLGFARKGAMCSTGTLMDAQQPFPIIPDGILLDL